MKALKKTGFLTLGVGLLALAACGSGGSSVKYARGDDKAIYNGILKEYNELYAEAAKETDDDERYVKYAKAEAALLDSGIMLPTTTQNGAYAFTRIAPRTVAYVLYGIDSDKVKGMVLTSGSDATSFITGEQREELLGLWNEARSSDDVDYDPKAYLTSNGFTLGNEYKTTFTTDPSTLDMLDTSYQADTETLCNCVEGLVEYDNLGQLRGLMAVEDPETGLPYELSEDGKTYTFTIRDDAKWYTADGAEYGSVTAADFVAGFHHMLDADSGLDYLVDGVVVGAEDYVYEGGSFSDVGVKADGQKFSITLTKPESFFPTRLVYSCFMPLNETFFKSKGGAFGSAYKEAKAAGTYKYGDTSDLSSILYNGPYIMKKWASESEIVLEKNSKYFDAAKVNIEKASWIYDDGSNPLQIYADVKGGKYPGMSLSAGNGTLAKAKEDGIFDTYKYITETNATSYFAGFNVNRGTFVLDNGACESTQTEEQKVATHEAMNNKNFRKALQHAFDRKTWNAISRGEDLAETNIRNMYTAPTFVALHKDVTDEDVEFYGETGHTFDQGTDYGEIVQFYYDLRGGFNTIDNLADGVDGFYQGKNSEYAAFIKDALPSGNVARAYYDAFIGEYVAEHGSFEGIQLDLVYYSASTLQVAQSAQFKKNIEEELPGVTVNLIEATTTADYYACGYRAAKGENNAQDVFYGSGWGPDFADPSSYLETFLPGGYMVKVCGINNF